MIPLIIAIKSACIAYVYAGILSQPGMLLGSWYAKASAIAAAYPQMEWLLKPLILCTICVTGQLSLWAYVLIQLVHIPCTDAILDTAFCCSVAILITEYLKKNLL